jgi:hypothetical protein
VEMVGARKIFEKNWRWGDCLLNTIIHYDKRIPQGEIVPRIQTF